MPDQRIDRALALARRAYLRQRIAVLGGNGQQGCEQRRVVRRVDPGLVQQPRQLVEFHIGAVIALEMGRMFQLADDRIERTLQMVRGTLVAHAVMRLIRHDIQQCPADARLANPSLAGHQGNPAIAGPRRPPKFGQA